jgi:hypothetical protein
MKPHTPSSIARFWHRLFGRQGPWYYCFMALFCIAIMCSGGYLAIKGIADGHIRLAARRAKTEVYREVSPGAYWYSVAVASGAGLLGTVGLGWSLREAVRIHRREKHGDT